MKSHRLFLYALDPTHIGAGGYRLGRVDNTISSATRPRSCRKFPAVP